LEVNGSRDKEPRNIILSGDKEEPFKCVLKSTNVQLATAEE
jgi:hypothetical protein